jgi:hypothetical protein
MRSKLIAAVAAAVVLGLVAFMFLPAAATPPDNLTATVVAMGATAKPVSVHSNGIEVESRGATDIYTVHNVFAVAQPPSSSGWHSHPGAVFVTVTAGTLTLYRRTCIAVPACRAPTAPDRPLLSEDGATSSWPATRAPSRPRPSPP